MSERTLGLDADMRRISNSEVATWNTCKRKYYYEFDLALEPKVTGGALGRGVLLHEILAGYYGVLKDGASHEEAVRIARQGLQQYLANDAFGMETVMEVDRLLQGYWAHYQGDPDWIIMEVEKGYDLEFTDEYQYALRLDLLVRSKSTGHVILVDHKTCYDFWTADDLDLNPQFPKYLGSLRSNGISVDKAMLNQIRTRKLKAPGPDDLFRRTIQVPSNAKIAESLKEQVIASQEIVAHRLLPLEVKKNTSLRVLNKQVCKYCNVRPLCMSEYDGGDITHMVANDYKARTYGYNDPTEEL